MLGKFKSLEVNLDRNNKPEKNFFSDTTIHATVNKYKVVVPGLLARDAVEILAAYPAYDSIEFELPTIYGKFNVKIDYDFSVEDAEDLINGLIDIQEEVHSRQQGLREEIRERINKNAGV